MNIKLNIIEMRGADLKNSHMLFCGEITCKENITYICIIVACKLWQNENVDIIYKLYIFYYVFTFLLRIISK